MIIENIPAAPNLTCIICFPVFVTGVSGCPFLFHPFSQITSLLEMLSFMLLLFYYYFISLTNFFYRYAHCLSISIGGMEDSGSAFGLQSCPCFCTSSLRSLWTCSLVHCLFDWLWDGICTSLFCWCWEWLVSAPSLVSILPLPGPKTEAKISSLSKFLGQ